MFHAGCRAWAPQHGKESAHGRSNIHMDTPWSWCSTSAVWWQMLMLASLSCLWLNPAEFYEKWIPRVSCHFLLLGRSIVHILFHSSPDTLYIHWLASTSLSLLHYNCWVLTRISFFGSANHRVSGLQKDSQRRILPADLSVVTSGGHRITGEVIYFSLQ